MSKKVLVLGYTRSGHAVLLPTRGTPNVTQFVSWTRGDHVDASSILAEHGEREQDPKIGPWCKRWAKAHRKLRKRQKKRSEESVRILGAAETSVRTPRRR